MITFGLTGGIASGKSTVTRTFIKHGIPMIDADIIARQVVEPNKFGHDAIVDLFGKEMLLEDGTLNRLKLAELVFCHPDHKIRKNSMDKLNALMGPLITEEASRQIAVAHAEGHDIVGYDAALIIEQGNADKFRPLIVVGCDLATQIQRLMSRNNLTVQEAMFRIEAQLPLHEKINYADYVIDTNGTVEKSIAQTEAIIKILKSK